MIDPVMTLRARPSGIAWLCVAALLLAGLLLQGATLPHSHSPSAPGLYNEEHDLTTLATRGADAPVPTAVPVVAVAVVAGTIVVAAVTVHDGDPFRHTAPRAPPAA
ncbi:MAG TPA: hypothetical protein VGL09_09265 [Methylomirabilota bacterium]|jgi:hypothetical protein